MNKIKLFAAACGISLACLFSVQKSNAAIDFNESENCLKQKGICFIEVFRTKPPKVHSGKWKEGKDVITKEDYNQEDGEGRYY